MITVSAETLWLRDGAWYDNLAYFSGEYAGDRLVTDQQLALRVNRVTGLEDVPTSIRRLHSAAEAGLDEWLASDPMVAVMPERLFPAVLLDPLEAAGFRVRPLDRLPTHTVHAVCVPGESWCIVGLLTALRRGTVPSESARTVSA